LKQIAQKDNEAATQPAISVERSILGCLMSGPGYDTLQEIAAIRPEQFYRDDSRKIFRTILTLVEQGTAPDLTLVYQQDQDLDPVDLASMRGEACMPSQIRYYTGLLQENHRRRTLEYALMQAQTEIASGQEREQIEERLINSLQQDRAEAETFGIAEGYDVQQLLDGHEAISGVMFGLPDVDAATAGGIKLGEVCISAARTSVGKSAFAVMAAINAVTHGTPVLYMSYEMPRQQVWRRALSYWSRVSLRKFRQGYFDFYDQGRVQEAYKDLQQGGFLPQIRINCKANRPGELLRLIRMEQLRFGQQLIIIDHAGRMLPDGKVRSDYERASEIANRLKDIALSCSVPMLALWQLNRSVEKTQDKMPTLADLRDTGQAEEIADSVLLMSRDSYYDSSIPITEATVTVDVAKARDGGKTGKVKVPWLSIISRPGPERMAGED
jgi:replicative DNA helicase